jgi:protein SCO1/2
VSGVVGLVCDNRGMKEIRLKLLWGAIAVCAAVAGFWLARELHSTSTQLASGTWLPHARELKPFTLTDQSGQPLTLERLSGRPTLVFFGFTHCPDVCPTTLATLAQARKRSEIPSLQVLLITVDPARDTPQLLEKYVHAFDPGFLGATGSQETIDAVTRDFGVAVQKVELPGGDYSMDHSAAIFLLNEHARIAAIFTAPIEAEALGADLRAIAPLLDR